MLRFDVPPVYSNVIRVEEFVTTVFSAIALAGFPYLMPVLAVMGLVRGLIGHQKCPSHRMITKFMVGMNKAGHKENAGAKMFANKILLIASFAASILFFMGNPLWMVPTTALLIFSTLEWAFSFCAACWVYGFWYKLFPPKMM